MGESSSAIIEGMPSPSQKITVSFSMKRSVWSVFMVTYLPTILMNAINQATVYIESENAYDLLLTINVTCMMVLASVYLSVSTSLPSTASIKPVECWLIFNLAYPFMLVIVATV